MTLNIKEPGVTRTELSLSRLSKKACYDMFRNTILIVMRTSTSLYLRNTIIRAIILAVPLVFIIVLVKTYWPISHNPKLWYVSNQGSDSADGTKQNTPLLSIQKAISVALPGDTIQLADGGYYQSFKTDRSGKKRSPITIKGSRNATIYGSTSRVIEINHDYIHLEGFHVDGKHGSGDKKEDYRDKLIYAIGTLRHKGVEGLKIDNLLIENAGGECVRLRYFARNNEITNSTIRNCGFYDYSFSGNGKNGEGIYIGTAPEQRGDGKNPTSDPDKSRGNWIHHNTIETNGNECVDIKEAASENLVEYNSCTGQRDSKSGGFNARGNSNTFRFNIVFGNVGAGFRLGGDGKYDGIDNNVYKNTIKNNQGGSIKILRTPQGKICGNTVIDNSVISTDEASEATAGSQTVC